MAAVHELHKAGYQRLRISPGMSPSGMHWRCPVTSADNVEPDGYTVRDWSADRVVAYTSAEPGAFGWRDVEGMTARALAARFISAFPALAAAGAGRDWAYAGWLTEVLGRVEQGDAALYPVFYADYPLDLTTAVLPPPP